MHELRRGVVGSRARHSAVRRSDDDDGGGDGDDNGNGDANESDESDEAGDEPRVGDDAETYAQRQRCRHGHCHHPNHEVVHLSQLQARQACPPSPASFLLLD